MKIKFDMGELRLFLIGLLLIFITLKLNHTIDWSWWWVLSPFLIPVAVAGVILLFIGIIYLYEYVWENRK